MRRMSWDTEHVEHVSHIILIRSCFQEKYFFENISAVEGLNSFHCLHASGSKPLR